MNDRMCSIFVKDYCNHYIIREIKTSSSLNFSYIAGNPLLAAYSPNLLMNFDENMNLWERFVNLCSILYDIYWYQYEFMPVQEKICRKYFGDSVPPAHQLVSNVTLLLAHFHPFIYPRANIPSYIPIRGYRPMSQKESLPEVDINRAT